MALVESVSSNDVKEISSLSVFPGTKTGASRSRDDTSAPLLRLFARRESAVQSIRTTLALLEGQHLQILSGSSAMLLSGSDRSLSIGSSANFSEQALRFILKPIDGVVTTDSSWF